MSGVQSVTVTSMLGAAAEVVWERATKIEGVNEELAPVLRMTVPRRLRGSSIAALEPGEAVGRSWLLLGGLVPVDYDDLCIVEIESPRRFLERSRMGSMGLWQHERVIDPRGAGACVLTDSLTFELRRPLAALPGASTLATRLVIALFGHRHRRLRATHGAAAR